MQEDLLGYLLGALTEDEQRRIEEALAVDPQLRDELEHLRGSLKPLEWLGEKQPPPAGLAERTLHGIERHEERCRPSRGGAVCSSAVGSDAETLAGSTFQARLAGLSHGIVLALVGLTAATLLLPALANSRYQARKNACQNNLRTIGNLVIDDSLRHGGAYILVPLSGKRAFSGIYASTLLHRQLITPQTNSLICPGAGRRQEWSSWSVPTFQEIDSATGAELDQLRQEAGGSYAYIVGYLDQRGRYRAIRNRGRPHFPILGDAPSFHLEGRQSANHCGRGQNIFFEDGHIRFITQLTELVGDDPIRNRRGNPEYGLDANDAVLLPSSMPPVVGNPPVPVMIDEAVREDERSGQR
ncbi:MAG: hypothetical protein ACQESR_25635 [Planctomycetota bacterium]